MRFRFFNVRIAILWIALTIAGCQKADEGIIDPFRLPPFLTEFVVRPTLVNSDTIRVGVQPLPTDTLTIKVNASVKVSDPEGLQDVREVLSNVYKPASRTLINSVRLLDDGKNPDEKSGDGIFSGIVSFKIVRTDIGDFRVEAVARDRANLSSNMVGSSVTIVRLNRPPVLSDLTAPDSVALETSTVLLRLSIRATDPDGQGDIQRVFFNSFRPDGAPSTGNPFEMFDDGSERVIYQPDIRSGDLIKGDGVYTLTIQLSATTTRGTYRFEFRAIDRSGAQSNVVVHFLRVR